MMTHVMEYIHHLGKDVHKLNDIAIPRVDFSVNPVRSFIYVDDSHIRQYLNVY